MLTKASEQMIKFSSKPTLGCKLMVGWSETDSISTLKKLIEEIRELLSYFFFGMHLCWLYRMLPSWFVRAFLVARTFSPQILNHTWEGPKCRCKVLYTSIQTVTREGDSFIIYMKTFPGPYVHQTTQNRILALFSALTGKGAVEGLAKRKVVWLPCPRGIITLTQRSQCFWYI
jgi:hypothetical protein